MSSKRIESFILSQWFCAGGKIELLGYVAGITLNFESCFPNVFDLAAIWVVTVCFVFLFFV